MHGNTLVYSGTKRQTDVEIDERYLKAQVGIHGQGHFDCAETSRRTGETRRDKQKERDWWL